MRQVDKGDVRFGRRQRQRVGADRLPEHSLFPRLAFAAFDLLDEALLVTTEDRHTVRILYLGVVGDAFSDDYQREFLALEDVEQESLPCG